MDQIKIYDVAGSAGVSLATVSRVLNHPEKVKPATREKVLKIIKDKGYKPNANARGLASRKSTTVAVVVPTLKRASISEMIQGIVDSANEYGYMIRLFVNDSTENEQDVWGNVIASSVDGILLMNNEMSREVFELIQYTPVPVIFVNGISRTKAFGSVGINYEKCGYEVTKQMIEKGNKKITFVTTLHPYLVNELMVKGYLKAMEEGNLEPDIIKTTGVLEQNEQDFTTYLNDKTPEVVLAVRDSMAVSFMNIAQKRGISVPEQLQVIGFQNTRYSELSYPKLTCVDIPIYDIGSTAMSELTKLMKEDVEVKPAHVTVDYKVVWRDSTK
jgi:LacI family transcriptional regulator